MNDKNNKVMNFKFTCEKEDDGLPVVDIIAQNDFSIQISS